MAAELDVEDVPTPRGGTLDINGSTWAVGLAWLPVEDADNLKEEIRAQADDDNGAADFVCQVNDIAGRPQIGVGWKDGGHAAGQPALAAAMVTAIGPTWVGVFKVGNWFWFGAAIDGYIRKDVLYEDESDAQKVLRAHLEGKDDAPWEAVFAPANWRLPKDSRPGNLIDLVGGQTAPKLSFILSFGRRYAGVFIALAILMVMGAAGAYWWWDQEQQRIAAEQAAIEARRKAEIAKPWMDAPMPSLVLSACRAGAGRVPIDVPEWTTTQLNCSDGRVSGVWRMGQNAQWDHLRMAASAADMSVILRSSGDEAVGTAVLPRLPDRKSQKVHPGLLPMDEAQARMLRINQRLGARVQLKLAKGNAAVASAAGPSANGQRAPRTIGKGQMAAGTQLLSYSVTARYPLLSWNEVFDAIPGMVVDAATFELKNNTWTVTGKIYVKQ